MRNTSKSKSKPNSKIDRFSGRSNNSQRRAMDIDPICSNMSNQVNLLNDRIKRLQQISDYSDVLLAHNNQYQQIVDLHHKEISQLKKIAQQKDAQIKNMQKEKQICVKNLYQQNERQVAELMNQLKSAKQYIEQISNNYSKLKQQFQREQFQKAKEFQTLKIENQKLRQEIAQIIFSKNSQIGQLKSSLADSKDSLRNSNEDNMMLVRKISHLEDEVKMNVRRYEELSVINLGLDSRYQRLLKDHQQYQDRIVNLNNQLNNLRKVEIQCQGLREEKKRYSSFLQNAILKEPDIEQVKTARIQRAEQIPGSQDLLDKITKLSSQNYHYKQKYIQQNEKLVQMGIRFNAEREETDRLVIELQNIVKQDKLQFKRLVQQANQEKQDLQHQNKKVLRKVQQKYQQLLEQQEEVYTKKIRVLQQEVQFIKKQYKKS